MLRTMRGENERTVYDDIVLFFGEEALLAVCFGGTNSSRLVRMIAVNNHREKGRFCNDFLLVRKRLLLSLKK